MRLHLYTYTQAVAWGATASLGRVGARSILATARSGRVAAGGRGRRRHGVPQQAGVRTGGPGRRHRRDRGCAGRLPRVGALPGSLRGDPGRRVGLAGRARPAGDRCGEGTRAMGSWARVASGARAGACCAGWPACTCSDWRCWPMPPAAPGRAGALRATSLAGLAGLSVAALIAPDLLGTSGREVLAGLRAGAWPAVRVAPAILLQWLAAAPWGLLFWVLLWAGWAARRKDAPPAWWGLWAFALLANLRYVPTGYANGFAVAPALAALWWLAAGPAHALSMPAGSFGGKRGPCVALLLLVVLAATNLAGQMLSPATSLDPPRALGADRARAGRGGFRSRATRSSACRRRCAPFFPRTRPSSPAAGGQVGTWRRDARIPRRSMPCWPAWAPPGKMRQPSRMPWRSAHLPA